MAVISTGVLDYAEECTSLTAIAKTADSMRKEIDFSLLYNKNRGLLYIGYNTEKEEFTKGCYDTYMSEARTAYYIAIAEGQIPAAAWQRLSRITVTSDSHIGLLSYGGTAFEYFMPAMFLPVIVNSMEYESLRFAAETQHNNTVSLNSGKSQIRLFGMSEAAYYRYDNDMVYQYKTFGDPSLGMMRGLSEEKVYAPYSLYLMLGYTASSANTICRLKETPLYGRYGLYESVDITPARVGGGYAVIKCCMSHHMGMSLTSAVNYLYGDIMKKRFTENPDLKSAEILLEEKIPADAVPEKIKPLDNTKPGIARILPHFEDGEPKNENEILAILTQDTNIIADIKGNIGIMSAGIPYFVSPFCTGSAYDRMIITVKHKNGEATEIPKAAGTPVKLKDGIELRFSQTEKGRKAEILLSLFIDMLTDSAVISVCGSGLRRGDRVCLSFVPLLEGKRAYESHPEYSKLFCEAEPCRDGVLIKRRSKDFEKPDMYLAAVCSGSCEAAVDGKILQKNITVPVLGRRTELAFDVAGSKTAASFAFFYSSDKKEAYKKAAAAVIGEERRKNTFPITPEMKKIINAIYCERFYAYGNIQPEKAEIGELWRFGISGDLPIALIDLRGDESFAAVKGYADAHAKLFDLGIMFDLVFIKNDDDTDTVTGGITPKTGSHSGIYVIKVNKVTESFISLLYRISFFVKSSQLYKMINIEDGTDIRKRAFTNTARCSMDGNGIGILKGIESERWSYLYCGSGIGTILTASSLGYTWFGNAKEQRITEYNGEVGKDCGETVYAVSGGVKYNLCSFADKVDFLRGGAVYYGKADCFAYTVRCCVDTKLNSKLISVEIENSEMSKKSICVSYSAHISMSEYSFGGKTVITERKENGIYIRNCFSAGLANFETVIEAYKRAEASIFANRITIFVNETVQPGQCTAVLFTLSVCPVSADKLSIIRRNKYSECGIGSIFNDYRREYDYITGKGDGKELLCEYYLPYQALCARLLGRTGLFQCSGAYGFRDQLQDAMCMAFYSPDILKYQILRCASRQYEEGDVQHWWHPKNSGAPMFGIRTTCSDDLLWFPLALSYYCEITEDYSLTQIKLHYLSSEPLLPGTADRGEYAGESSISESLYLHCTKALGKAMERTGANGMPLWLAGDWNDAQNAAGKNGTGTSVWLAEFEAIVLEKFAQTAAAVGKHDDSRKYLVKASELRAAIEENAWNGESYVRGFTDNGKAVGSPESETIKTDLLTQVFAVFLFGKTERTQAAIKTALQRLYDPKTGIIKLFEPAVTDYSLGIISAYPPGIRENGGQYTHAAVWMAAALFELGEKKTAEKLWRGLLPDVMSEKTGIDIYKGEPYAAAGDVYTANGVYGQAGWTQYTGSCGWLTYVYLHYMCGICGKKEDTGIFSHENTLRIIPENS